MTFSSGKSRDANLRRSKIWRLSLFHYPQKFNEPGPPPPPHPSPHPRQIWKSLRTLYEVLHEVYTIKIRDHRFDPGVLMPEIIFVSD